jgi:hypothetical protein
MLIDDRKLVLSSESHIDKFKKEEVNNKGVSSTYLSMSSGLEMK